MALSGSIPKASYFSQSIDADKPDALGCSRDPSTKIEA